MLNRLQVVGLLCRLITKEKKLAILEESLLVAIAVLLGGNLESQTQFHRYIVMDEDNAFLSKISDMTSECFEKIKKLQQKRIQKQGKIIDLDARMDELDPEEDEDDY